MQTYFSTFVENCHANYNEADTVASISTPVKLQLTLNCYYNGNSIRGKNPAISGDCHLKRINCHRKPVSRFPTLQLCHQQPTCDADTAVFAQVHLTSQETSFSIAPKNT